MKDKTWIAVELEVEASTRVETLLEVIQHKMDEVHGFEIKGQLPECSE